MSDIEWVRVSERLPDDYVHVIATIERRDGVRYVLEDVQFEPAFAHRYQPSFSMPGGGYRYGVWGIGEMKDYGALVVAWAPQPEYTEYRGEP